VYIGQKPISVDSGNAANSFVKYLKIHFTQEPPFILLSSWSSPRFYGGPKLSNG